MRLARLDGPDGVVPAAHDGARWHDLRPLTQDVDGRFLSAGLDEAREVVAAGCLPRIASHRRFLAPVARPGKVVGIGLNYKGYAAGLGQPEPAVPVVFLKSPTAVCGPDDTVVAIPGSRSTDAEIELGLVIGRRVDRSTPEAELAGAIAGYVLANDLTDRDLQLGQPGTWTAGKSADTFCPLGPWVVTADEVPDPLAVTLTLRVNGTVRQHESTADLVHDPVAILRHLGPLMTLEPGDVVLTGTPHGCAVTRPEPRPYLRDGDVLDLEARTSTGVSLGRQHALVRVPAEAQRTDGTEPAPRRTAAVVSGGTLR